jgi:integrase
MASVRQKPKSKYWYACITGTDGKQRQFSTGKTERSDALAMAVAAERAIRRPKPSQVRASLMRLMEEFEDPDTVDAGEYFRQWLKGKAGEISPKSYDTYQTTIDAVTQWLKAERIIILDAITAEHIKAMRETWTMAASTKNLRLKVIRAAFGHAHRTGIIAANPAANVSTLRAGVTTRREFRTEELKTLLSHVTGEWRVLTLLGLYTGQRISDLATLRWQAIDMTNATIHLTTSKTGRLVSLPLLDPVTDALATLPAGNDPTAHVLPDIARRSPGNRSNAFRAILQSCGLAPSRKYGKRENDRSRKTSELSFHSLRHTATTLLKASGVSDSIARAIIGHESAAVSRTYTHLDLDTIRQAMAKIPAL